MIHNRSHKTPEIWGPGCMTMDAQVSNKTVSTQDDRSVGGAGKSKLQEGPDPYRSSAMSLGKWWLVLVCDEGDPFVGLFLLH